ncbi:hypothetical protein AALA61_05960 [Oscillospiraceae bacterium 42-9]
MEHNIHINNEYAAILLIEILFEKGLVNKLTYINVKKRLRSQTSQ